MLRPAAAADVEETYHLYETRRDGYGDEYLSVVSQALEAIERRPQLAPVVFGDIRRQLLKHFPQGLFYRVIDDQVVVLACLPARRNP